MRRVFLHDSHRYAHTHARTRTHIFVVLWVVYCSAGRVKKKVLKMQTQIAVGPQQSKCVLKSSTRCACLRPARLPGVSELVWWAMGKELTFYSVVENAGCGNCSPGKGQNRQHQFKTYTVLLGVYMAPSHVCTMTP